MISAMCIVGGYDHSTSRDEILVFDGEDWKEVGQLKNPRDRHAVTKIDMSNMVGFCN